jgi:hypothetical protein
MPNLKADSFQCGPFEVLRNPSATQFAEKLNRLREAIDSCRIMPGVGYTFNRSSGGTTLSIKNPPKSGSGATLLFPFKITLKIDKNIVYYFVTLESYLYWTDGESKRVAGIGAWNSLGSKDDNKKYIYLEAKYNANTANFISASILSGKDAPVLVGNGVARCVIATISKTQQITQNVRSHLIAVNACWNGNPSIVIQFSQTPI